MGQYIGQYLKALTATIVAMVLYCLSVVPLIEPTEQRSYEIPSDPGIEVADTWWQKLFNENDWQLQDPTVVHNARGVLLAKNWEQIRPESWKLTPLTIILADKSAEDSLGDQVDPKNVMIITAQDAIIHFEQPFDMRSGTMPSVQKGMLSGEIVISQVNTSDPNARPWTLRTRDVSIDRRRIWTQQEVSIDFDNSRIRGHDLRINLLSDILSKRTEQSDDWATKYGPLEEIELIHLTELSVALKPGGIWANVGPEMLQLNQPAINLPARVEATCGGRFTFNFSKEMMSLNGGVHLKHFLGGLPPDEFLCHRMNLQLQSPQESTDPKGASSGIAVRDIEAFGIDSLEEFVGEKWVELRSPVVGATARAKRMHYNLTNQRVELFGKLDQAGATVSIAELNYRGYQFQAPTLQYQPAPKGADGRAVHGGWMAAQGAGELSSPPDSRLGEIHVRWQDKFTWSPTNVPGEQLIELSGQTLVEQKKQGFLTADILQIWLASVPRDEQLSAALTPNRQAWNGLQPRRIQSKGKSVIATNKAKVNVQTLDLKFAYPQVPSGDLVSQPSSSIKNPLERFVGQPPLGTQPASSSTGDQPIEIDGQLLVATVAVASKLAWIDAMTIHGPLSLKSPDGQATASWKVDGTALHLASSPQGELDVEIEGQPATIHVADGSIQGPRIGFNQKQNRIWMDQPGEFTLPMNLKSGPTNLQWVKPLTCRWKKRMTFDGTKIRFEGDIDLFGTMQQTDGLWFVKGTCQELDLLMAQPLSLGQLGNLQQMNSTSQLQQIVLRENVDLLASHRDNIGNRLSVGRLKVPTTLTIQVDQETIRAAGPGRCYSNFVSNRDVGSTVSSRQNSPNLDSIGLAYRDSLVVFMARREVVVDGNVKILMSPIQSWDQEPNPDNVTRLTEGQFSCNCDQVKLYDTGSLNSTQSTLSLQGRSIGAAQWEAQATGNVRFDGNTDSGEYSGNAYQIVYVQAKNLLRVAGDGRSKAMIKKLASFTNGKSEPTTTWKMNSGLFNVKNRGMLDSSGIEVHLENPDQPGTSPGPNTLPNGQVNPQTPGMGPVGPNSPPIDPRDRAINNLLRGYGTQ